MNGCDAMQVWMLNHPWVHSIALMVGLIIMGCCLGVSIGVLLSRRIDNYFDQIRARWARET